MKLARMLVEGGAPDQPWEGQEYRATDVTPCHSAACAARGVVWHASSGKHCPWCETFQRCRPIFGARSVRQHKAAVRLIQLGDCHQQLAPMPDSDNAESREIFGGEMAQYFRADVILTECPLVAFKTKVSHPACDIHSRSPGLRDVSRSVLEPVAEHIYTSTTPAPRARPSRRKAPRYGRLRSTSRKLGQATHTHLGVYPGSATVVPGWWTSAVPRISPAGGAPNRVRRESSVRPLQGHPRARASNL